MSHLYEVLGVGRGADAEEVKSAFRWLAKTCHPDLHGGDARAEQRFKDINLAYETLGNPEARAKYDSDCAAERIAVRQRFRSAAATMAATFALTVGSGLYAAAWLLSA